MNIKKMPEKKNWKNSFSFRIWNKTQTESSRAFWFILHTTSILKILIYLEVVKEDPALPPAIRESSLLSPVGRRVRYNCQLQWPQVVSVIQHLDQAGHTVDLFVNLYFPIFVFIYLYLTSRIPNSCRHLWVVAFVHYNCQLGLPQVVSVIWHLGQARHL